MSDLRPDTAHAIRLGGRSATWEYREFSFPRGTSIQEARVALTEEAEYGYWELARVRIFRNGGRRVWLRRKTYAVSRTALTFPQSFS